MAIIDRDGVPGKICSKCKLWQPITEFSPKVVRGIPHGDGHQPWCKNRHRIRARNSYQEDLEKYRKRARDYFERNSEQKHAYDKRRYYDDIDRQRERKRIYSRERAQADPEGNRTRSRTWYYKNLERARARNRESRNRKIKEARERVRRWMKAHPERVAAYQRARRVRLAGGGGSHTEAEWVALKANAQLSAAPLAGVVGARGAGWRPLPANRGYRPLDRQDTRSVVKPQEDCGAVEVPTGSRGLSGKTSPG